MKLILSILFSMTCLGLFAQKDSIYRNLHEALKNPLEVYQLELHKFKNSTELEKISEFKNLVSLKLIFCDLKKLPKGIYDCVNLETLVLKYNLFLELDEQIQVFTKLKYLDIGISGTFKNFENTIGKLENLEELIILAESFDLCKVLVFNNLKKVIVTYWGDDGFQLPNCSFEGLQLKSVCIRTEDCCWPYLKTSSEKIQQMQSLLPLGCKLHGLSTGSEIRSDVELR